MGTQPLDFEEIRKRSSRPWGGALKSYRCFCCGSGLNLANHHITPRDEGGSDHPRNKVTLCSKCHDAVEGMAWTDILARRESFQREAVGSSSESPETFAEYFSRQTTPSANSPVGRLMVAVVAKFPHISFNDARNRANALLDVAAGKRVYRIPPVLTDEERDKRCMEVRERFRVRKAEAFA